MSVQDLPIELQLTASLPMLNINNEVVGIDSRFNEIFWILYVSKLCEKLDRSPNFDAVDSHANIRLSRVDGRVKCPAFMSSLVHDVDIFEKISRINPLYSPAVAVVNNFSTTNKKSIFSIVSPFVIMCLLCLFIVMIQCNFYMKSRLKQEQIKVWDSATPFNNKTIANNKTAFNSVETNSKIPVRTSFADTLNQRLFEQYPLVLF